MKTVPEVATAQEYHVVDEPVIITADALVEFSCCELGAHYAVYRDVREVFLQIEVSFAFHIKKFKRPAIPAVQHPILQE